MRRGMGLRLGDVVTGAAAKSTLVNDLVSYWSLDEASGTRADLVGSSDLTDNNTVGSAAGKNNAGADFVTANAEYLNGDYTSVDQMTVSAWIKPGNLANYNVIVMFSENGAGSTSEIAFTTRDCNSIGIYAADVGWILYPATFSVGEWYHLVLTHKKTAKEVGYYVNGEAVSGSPATYVPNNTKVETAIHIGGEVAALWSQALIDVVGVWDRVLETDEIAELYNGGDGKYYNATSENFEE